MKRREFIRKSAVGTTGMAVAGSALTVSSCSVKGAGDKIVLALIGSGTRGIEVATGMCRTDSNISFKYVCDVNDLKAQNGIHEISKVSPAVPVHVRDMKEVFDDRDVDAVIIATPEHWHALATIRACQARKDVYVEACPTLTLWEGKKMIEASKRYKRIVQAGFQNRSAKAVAAAREFISSGQLGQVVHVKTYNMTGGNKWTALPDSDIPAGLDWNLWLGPAPERPYNAGIHDMTGRGGWDNFWAYSGGSLSVQASHVLDIARFVTGDPGHPGTVYCCGGNRIWDSEREGPELQEITYDFGRFFMTCENCNGAQYLKRTSAFRAVDGQPYPDWMHTSDRIEVYGTKGLMYIGCNGGGWQVIGTDDKTLAGEPDTRSDELHWKNFLESIRTGQQVAAGIDQGHMSASVVHLGNIAFRAGNKKLVYDPVKEEFTNEPEANRFLRYAYRKGFEIPEKV